MKRVLHFCIIALALPTLLLGQGFHTDGGRLLDANGNEFIMKGLNAPLAWYRNDVPNSLDDIRNNTGSNCIRIVMETGTPDNVWQDAVQKCIDNDMIPMVELHDYTGSTNTSAPNTAAQWFAQRATYFNQPEIKKHILINICNEWGTWQTATNDANNNNGGAWLTSFTTAIQTLRNAGITTTLVIDAVGYGQDIQTAKNIRDDAKTMMASDASFLGGNPNLLFSIHMYCEWRKGANDPAIVKTIKDSGIPIMVGEFGYQHATDGSCDIDEQNIMDQCQAAGVGWLAWSQKGNGSPVEYLDLCNDWNCTNLSTWGNTVFNGRNGTKTSQTCSVFLTSNAAPTVAITAPVNNSIYEAPASITITATAEDTDGTISKVEFYNGDVKLGEDNTSPYTYTWANVVQGEYTITAVATDNGGAKKTSVAKIIKVNPYFCPEVNLGFDQILCSGSTLTLNSGITTTTGVTFTWKRGAQTITGSGATLQVNQTGIYSLTAERSNCTASVDEIVVTSGTLNTTGDEICAAGKVNLAVSGGKGGPYTWYDALTGGNELTTGTTYSPTVQNTTTFYVGENSTINEIITTSIGKTTESAGATFWNIDDFDTNDKQVRITVTEALTIDAISVYPSNTNTNVTIRVLTTTNNVVVSKTVNGLGTGKQRLELGFDLEPGTYVVDAMGTNKTLRYDSDMGNYPYSLPEVLSITGNASWVMTEGRYGIFYDWEITTERTVEGNTCERTPVVAIVNSNGTNCNLDCAGVPNGNAMVDNCNQCTGGTTGLSACVQDCNSEWGGEAFVDSCGTCASGSTTVTPVLDIDECITSAHNQLVNEVLIYPNPTSGFVYIQSNIEQAWVLYNTIGVEVLSGINNQLDMSNLNAGVYHLNVEGKIFRLIKE